MKWTKIFLFAVFFNAGIAPILCQAIVEGEEVYYPFSHSIDYDQKVYKTAVRIDELGLVVTENLALRVYYPTDIEPGDQRPLVVLVHGGGFIAGTYASFFDEAESLAQLGYVAVSVQYRLCQRNDCLVAAALTYPCSVSWANSLVPSSYVAAVDVQDAIEWLVLHASDYNIDSENIAIGGHSAGGITALNVAYMDQAEVNEICNGCGTWPDYLQGELEENSGIKAVFTMSGAIYDTSWMDTTENEINLLAIHGTDDGVVSYGTDPVYPCCNTYSVPVHGACPVIQRQQEIGGNAYLLSGNDFGHNVLDGEWWPFIQDQILWFLGKSFFDDTAFQKHTEWIRSTPVNDCPAPLQPVLPAQLCGIPLSDPSNVIFGFPNSVAYPNLSAGINISPNPASEVLEVDLSGIDKDLDCQRPGQIFDVWGRPVMSFNLNMDNHQTLDVSGLLNGVYFLRIEICTQAFAFKRFVVNR